MEVVVIGGGIVGCHMAYRLAKEGKEVFLLEKEKALGEHTSTRNSGVIHGGIYYPQESLKAKLCVRGRHLTYEFLQNHDVPHWKCGKIIVALVASELKALEKLKKQGEDNGVENLRLIDEAEVPKIEPRVRCLAALHSPETGILDMAVYIRVMERMLKGLGVTIVKQCEVLSIDDPNTLETTRGEMEAEMIINAAGLYSDSIAGMCGLEGYEIIPHKGDYYNTTEEVIRGLVYPVPDSPHSLGIHLTRTLGEETLIGPSAIQVSDKDDYEIRTPREEFEKGALAMIPDFNVHRIYPGYSGNRPKLYCHGELQTDFVIQKQEKGRVHLMGIESPGLTAAPAIAEYVAKMIK
ncbi:MAG: FAD-dependent oxidoreductase [Deltaproteobacteria bacterium CG03_land_8_20_14_0_80_45_14]|nr:MAG: FAD-dependent oxidoreductase [Deltaproteobacteria bacterium CG03_land_8_20_14_0_80_45_14]